MPENSTPVSLPTTEEIWKDIPGLEGNYQVSSLGRARSLDKLVRYSDGRKRIHKGQPLSPGERSGYLYICPPGNKSYYIHQMVALLFIPNPENKPQVNHKNGKTHDNRAENLEWATASENALHAFRILNRKPGRHATGAESHAAKKVARYASDGSLVAVYDSLTEARDAMRSEGFTGVGCGQISRCCRGQLRHTHGFTFKYV